MKPVATSIVALALAMVPMTVWAGPSAKATTSHVEAHVAGAKGEAKTSTTLARRSNAHKGTHARAVLPKKKGTAKVTASAKGNTIERATQGSPDETYERIERSERSVVVRVRHARGHGRASKGQVPEVALVPVSLTSKVEPRGKASVKLGSPAKEHETPAVPADKASKPVAGKVLGASTIEALPTLPDPTGKKTVKVRAEGPSGAHAMLAEDGSERDALKRISDDEVAALMARHAPAKGLARVAASEPAKASEPKSAAGARRGKADDKASASKTPACTRSPVAVVRGPEIDTFRLTRCDGSIAPLAIERLSVLVRPGSAARPTVAAAELAKKKGRDLAHGIRRIDERLAYRLQAIVDHFTKPGTTAKVLVVSGYRPTSTGSMHATGRAIDFRLEGAKNEEVIAFCKTLSDTGCGYYPNSSFVHIDVRDAGAGHVAWIDASGPGESPRYVPAWPPAERAPSPLENAGARQPVRNMERELDEISVDEHPDQPIEAREEAP